MKFFKKDKNSLEIIDFLPHRNYNKIVKKTKGVLRNDRHGENAT